MNDSFMKERPVFPLLISMALPMVISMLVNSLYNIVDSFFVAKISEDAMTALSLVYPVQNFINAVAIGFGVGMTAVISLYLGAEDHGNANLAATHGLLYSILHGVLLTAGSMLLMPRFLRMFTEEARVVELGIEYSTIVFSFSIVIMLNLWYEKVFQSVGRMKITMAGMMCGCIANIILDPLLIFGFGGFPGMGIRGAALATGIGQVITLIVYAVVYAGYPISVRVGREYLVSDKRIDAKLYAVGIPAILNLALPSLLVSVLNGLLALYSQGYVVVLGVYYKLQTFLYLPANGIIQGMRPIIGYNFGAGEHERVKKIYQATLAMSGAIMAVGTLACLLASGNLIALFTDNPETVMRGKTALRIISAGFVVSAVSVTSAGALEGIGKGFQSLLISLCRYAAIIIPSAFLLCRILGAAGVWHAFWITETVTAVIAAGIYRKTVKAR